MSSDNFQVVKKAIMERPGRTNDVAARLGIQTITARKWLKALERQGEIRRRGWEWVYQENRTRRE